MTHFSRPAKDQKPSKSKEDKREHSVVAKQLSQCVCALLLCG